MKISANEPGEDNQSPPTNSLMSNKDVFSPPHEDPPLGPGRNTRRQQALSGIPLSPVELFPARRTRKRTLSNDEEDLPVARRSAPSLEWDDHVETPNFNSTLNSNRTCSLLYNHTVGSLGSGQTGSHRSNHTEPNVTDVEEEELEEVFDDAVEQEAEVHPQDVDLPLDQGDTEEESPNDSGNTVVVQQMAAANMTDKEEEIARNRAIIELVDWTIGDDISTVEIDIVGRPFLERRMEQAEELKVKLREAGQYLWIHDREGYNVDYKQQHTELRGTLSNFVTLAQRRMAAMDAEASAEVVAPRNLTERAQAAVRDIKATSVANYYQAAIDEMTGLVNGLKLLKFSSADAQSDFKKEEQKQKALAKQIESAKTDAERLRVDAVDAGMAREAGELETGLRDLKAQAKEITGLLLTQRRERNLPSTSGPGSGQRSADIVAPSFTGDSKDGIDFFKFSKDLMEYEDVMMPTKSELVRILLTKCLKGEALLGCSHMTTREQIMGHLKKTYGNVKVMINQILADVRKLGKCTGDEMKIRSWLLAVQGKLEYAKTLATIHNLEHELYHSRIAIEVQERLPGRALDDFLVHLETVDGGADLPPHRVFEELMKRLQLLINRYNYRMTLGTRLDEVEYLGERPAPQAEVARRQQQQQPQGNRQQQRRNYAVDTRDNGPGTSSGFGTYAVAAKKENCNLCPEKHTYLYYCPVFQKANFEERYDLARKAGNCFRCLVVATCVDFTDRRAWFEKHKQECDTEWACMQGKCANKSKSSQMSFLLCLWHARKNIETEARFLRSLDKSELKGNVRFMFNAPFMMNWTLATGAAKPVTGWTVLPDVSEPSIFMLTYVLIDGMKFLTFFDSGCSTASISSRVKELLETEERGRGPSEISVAGGGSVKIPGGEERFSIPLADGKTRCTVTALEMPQITSPFPVWETNEAYMELEKSYRTHYPDGPPLPTPPLNDWRLRHRYYVRGSLSKMVSSDSIHG